MGNLRRHLVCSHPSIANQLDVNQACPPAALEERQQGQPSVQAASSSSTSEQNPPSAPQRNVVRQQSITSYVHRPVSTTSQQKLDDQLLKALVCHHRPFSQVDDEQFRVFINMLNPGYQMPGRKTLSGRFLETEYEKLKFNVKNTLANVSAVFAASITTDTWTSRRNEDYIAVTCHFVDEEAGAIASLLLECCRVPNSHTAQNLCDLLTDILNKWGVLEKTVCLTTDNANNVVAAVKLLKKKTHAMLGAYT